MRVSSLYFETIFYRMNNIKKLLLLIDKLKYKFWKLSEFTLTQENFKMSFTLPYIFRKQAKLEVVSKVEHVQENIFLFHPSI